MTTRDGINIHYTVHGDPRRDVPRLVLIHSLAMNEAVWAGVIERLGDAVVVLTYDCRGHGASAKAPGPYRVETFGRDLADLLDHLGWDRVHLVGGSMGGSVALQFAVLYPDRLHTLALIDTTAWYGPEAAQRWDERARKAEEGGLASMMNFQETRWFTDGFRERHPEQVGRARSIFLANDIPAFAATCRMLGAFDLRAELSSIRVPTAVVVGEEDYATPPEMARVLHHGIAGATLDIIPEARHLTFIEKPDVVASILTNLIQRTA